MAYNQFKIKINYMSEDKKPSNEFRIGFKSNPKDVISQCEKLLKENKIKELHLSAVANSIGELSIIVEILKSNFPNLFQKNIFSVITPRSNGNEKKAELKKKKLYPRLEIILSTEKIVQKEESPTKITEEERQLLIETIDKQKESFRKLRKNQNPFRRNRRWRRFSKRPGKSYSYSAKRTTFNGKKARFNARRPFGKAPIRRKNNVKKPNSSSGRKSSVNKQASPVKN